MHDDRLGRKLAVVSPHLDDAVLSLGATIHALSRVGVAVDVFTFWAGDPDSTDPASEWDRRCGFDSARAATIGRRQEDQRAVAAVGATGHWFPFKEGMFGDEQIEEKLEASLLPELEGAEAILLPGHPLVHPDHLRLTNALLPRLPRGARVGFYAEQPYAFNRRGAVPPSAVGPEGAEVTGIDWTRRPASISSALVKRRAIRHYASQLSAVGLGAAKAFRLERMLWSEWRAGGESIGWPSPDRR